MKTVAERIEAMDKHDREALQRAADLKFERIAEFMAVKQMHEARGYITHPENTEVTK